MRFQNTLRKKNGTERQAELRAGKRPHLSVEVVTANTKRAGLGAPPKGTTPPPFA